MSMMTESPEIDQTVPDARKRIVICCDGTWSVPDNRCAQGRLCPTNVTKTALAVARRDSSGRRQLVYYGRGVGTGRWDRLRGGAFGVGLSANIRDAYAYLIDVYHPGDDLYLFGFSRGAYAVRSLAGLIRNCGVLQPRFHDRLHEAYALYRRGDPDSHPTARESQLFRRTYSWEAEGAPARIKFVGVWDTVGALGIPVGLLARISVRLLRLRFHDVKLSSYVDNAFHALAIDERRRAFAPTLWQRQEHSTGQRVEQVWFAGVHSNVGGGETDAHLSDIAFLWMRDRAVECGLAFDERAVAAEVSPDPCGKLFESWRGIYRLIPPRRRTIEATGTPPRFGYVHRAALERREHDPTYRPPNLPEHPASTPPPRN
jgi:uncharacterized protein (DUF2235 family)